MLSGRYAAGPLSPVKGRARDNIILLHIHIILNSDIKSLNENVEKPALCINSNEDWTIFCIYKYVKKSQL